MPTIRTPTAKTAPLNETEFNNLSKLTVVYKSSNYNLDATHNREIHELANGVTALLPVASSGLTEIGDWSCTFIAMGASATIDTNSQNVNGSSTNITLSQYETVTISMNNDATAFIKVHKETEGLGTASVEDIGTSGANVPLLNGANTWSGKQTMGAAFDATGVCTVTGSLAVDNINLNGSVISDTSLTYYRGTWYYANTSDLTTFPLGSVIAVVTSGGGTIYQRGTYMGTLYKHGSNNWWYHDYTYSSGGTSLTGSWKSLGSFGLSGGQQIYVAQRYA